MWKAFGKFQWYIGMNVDFSSANNAWSYYTSIYLRMVLQFRCSLVINNSAKRLKDAFHRSIHFNIFVLKNIKGFILLHSLRADCFTEKHVIGLMFTTNFFQQYNIYRNRRIWGCDITSNDQSIHTHKASKMD